MWYETFENKQKTINATVDNKLVDDIVEWIRKQVPETRGITIGVSGGKDSTVALALCAKAVGVEYVQAVLLPNGIQRDINDSEEICKFLGVKPTIINIGNIYREICSIDTTFDEKTKSNIIPRIRMTVLYALAQTYQNRVCGTGNLCERAVGWCTKWGDTACDFNPLGNLTVSQIIEIGRVLGLPSHLLEKAPADGITGKTDEENLGFTYDDIEFYLGNLLNGRTSFVRFPEIETKIFERSCNSYHKIDSPPMYVIGWDKIN